MKEYHDVSCIAQSKCSSYLFLDFFLKIAIEKNFTSSQMLLMCHHTSFSPRLSSSITML